jgi:hypothetical protein
VAVNSRVWDRGLCYVEVHWVMIYSIKKKDYLDLFGMALTGRMQEAIGDIRDEEVNRKIDKLIKKIDEALNERQNKI